MGEGGRALQVSLRSVCRDSQQLPPSFASLTRTVAGAISGPADRDYFALPQPNQEGSGLLQGLGGGEWAHVRQSWKRIGQQTRDYWNDACRHLKARP